MLSINKFICNGTISVWDMSYTHKLGPMWAPSLIWDEYKCVLHASF